jgi:hypothetical protein
MNARTTTLALIVMLLMTGISAAGSAPVTQAATQYLQVAVTNNYPGDVPQYTLTFSATTTIRKGDLLTLTFDAEVARARNGDLPASDIQVDTTFLTSSPEWSGNTLELHSPIDLVAGTEHVVVIMAGALIQNPWTPGHYQITLEHPASKTTLISGYYGITAVTRLVPVSLEKVVEHFQMTGVRIRIKTGRNGALTGHDPIGYDLLGAPLYPSQEDSITIRLSEGLSRLWATAGTVKVDPLTSSYPLVRTVPCITTIQSSTVYGTSGSGIDLRQLVLNLPHNIAASMELDVYLVFNTAQSLSSLSDTEYVKVYSSKETALVMVPPPATESGSGTQSETSADTTAPTVSWTSKASALLPRLVTLDIAVREENLDEAWFSGGTGSFIHTRLATGDNTVMVINRSGIHGTIVATDKAGNTTTVPVDLPAPSGS